MFRTMSEISYVFVEGLLKIGKIKFSSWYRFKLGKAAEHFPSPLIFDPLPLRTGARWYHWGVWSKMFFQNTLLLILERDGCREEPKFCISYSDQQNHFLGNVKYEIGLLGTSGIYLRFKLKKGFQKSQIMISILRECWKIKLRGVTLWKSFAVSKISSEHSLLAR